MRRRVRVPTTNPPPSSPYSLITKQNKIGLDLKNVGKLGDIKEKKAKEDKKKISFFMRNMGTCALECVKGCHFFFAHPLYIMFCNQFWVDVVKYF